MKKPKTYSSSALKKQIIADARSLKLAENWAETIADKTVKHVDAWITQRTTVTESDISRVACKKLTEFNSDLAYIYKNRGRIL